MIPSSCCSIISNHTQPQGYLEWQLPIPIQKSKQLLFGTPLNEIEGHLSTESYMLIFTKNSAI